MRRTFNRTERATVFIIANGRCELCGVELDENWEVDHRLPFSLGGDTTIENAMALCRVCNRRKSNMKLETYKSENSIELRPFEAHLHDGGVKWMVIDEGYTEEKLSEMESQVYQVLRNKDFWQPMVDKFVERLESVKSINSGFCGLIATGKQDHAKQVQRYLQAHHPRLRSLVAVSEDGQEAHRALQEFKAGSYDVLVTVSMAYVGYDHKPITVLLSLTHYRSEGYLRQLFARALRMWRDVPVEQQTMYAIVPADLRMQRFIESLRRESDWGAEERKKALTEEQLKARSGNSADLSDLKYLAEVWLQGMWAKGIDPTGDLTEEEYHFGEQLRRELDMPALPITSLMQFARAFHKIQQTSEGNDQKLENPPPPQPRFTFQEKMDTARSRLKDLARQCDSRLLGGEWGETERVLWRLYGGSVKEVTSLTEVEKRIQTVEKWLDKGRVDGRK